MNERPDALTVARKVAERELKDLKIIAKRQKKKRLGAETGSTDTKG